MSVRNLRYDGDSILRKKSFAVEKVDQKVKDLVEDMFDTMYKYNGVGLSAVQVGILKRIIIVDTGEEGEKIALINPEILDLKEEYTAQEGCLSFPELFADVRRFEYATVKGLDVDGNEVIIEASGLLAHVLQHEIDHLNGIVFVDLALEDSFFTFGKKGKKIPTTYKKDKNFKSLLEN